MEDANKNRRRRTAGRAAAHLLDLPGPLMLGESVGTEAATSSQSSFRCYRWVKCNLSCQWPRDQWLGSGPARIHGRRPISHLVCESPPPHTFQPHLMPFHGLHRQQERPPALGRLGPPFWWLENTLRRVSFLDCRAM